MIPDHELTQDGVIEHPSQQPVFLSSVVILSRDFPPEATASQASKAMQGGYLGALGALGTRSNLE